MLEEEPAPYEAGESVLYVPPGAPSAIGVRWSQPAPKDPHRRSIVRLQDGSFIEVPNRDLEPMPGMRE